MAVERSLKAVGQLLSGTYQIERKIAEGGMGVVYLASHVRLPRKFAIKVLARPHENSDGKVALERFKREAQVAAALKNPHVVQIYDYQIAEGGFPFIVMELLDGEDLARRLRRCGKLAPVEAVRVLEQIADALDAAHELGIIHRDLKPANVFLNDGPEPDFVKVLDFGVSKMLEWETITRTDALVGTPLYMSPEQAGGGQDVDSASDRFSFAIIAYELLTGTRPFTGKSIPAILYQVVNANPLPVSTMLGPQATMVDAVFAQGLAKAPELRYRSAREMVRALRVALQPFLPASTAEVAIREDTRNQETLVRLDGPMAPSKWQVAAPNEPTRALPAQEPVFLEPTRPSFPSSPSGPSRAASPTSLGAWGELALATPLPQSMPAESRLDLRRLLVGAVAVVVLASAITIGVRRGQARDAVVAPRVVDEPVVGEPAGPPRRVRIVVRTDPTSALALVDGTPVEDGAVSLPWQSTPRRLEVSAAGYRSIERAVDATMDREIEIILAPLVAPPSAAEVEPPRLRPSTRTSSARATATRSAEVKRTAPAPVKGTRKEPGPRPSGTLAAPVQDL